MADKERRWQGEAGADEEGYRPSAKQIGAGVVGIALLIFVLQNTDSTSITLLVFDVTFPLWLVLLVTILLSMAVGWVLGSRRRKD